MKNQYVINERVWIYDCPCSPRLARIVQKLDNIDAYQVEYEEGKEKLRVYGVDRVFKYPGDYKKLSAIIEDDAFYLDKTAVQFENEFYPDKHSLSKFVQGVQPCGNFKPREDGNGYGVWANEHSCPHDEGTRSFCENCGMDHHSGGWERHGITAKQDAERKSEELANNGI